MPINTSASHFRFGDLQEDLASAFFFQGINSGLVEVELTEEAVLHDLKLSSKKIRDLKQMGFSVTIDDLGTRRSSITYLQKLTVDIVKIDESFVQEILDSEFAIAIALALAVVDSMIRIAHTAKLRVVADGVESPAICDCLRTLNCDHVQGYLFGAACDAESLFAQLQLPAALASCHCTSM